MTAPTPPQDQYITEFNTKCINTFSKQPYEWQSDVGGLILRSKRTNQSPIHQLCIRPTGGGKSLLFTTLAACLGRITLCITPLLSLGADQTIKHQQNTKTKSRVMNSLHLDEVPKGDMQLVLDSLLATAPSSSILVYASPQSLVTKATGRSAFLELILAKKHLLSMIVIDEIHLLTDFGRSFRVEINMLKEELFQKVKETTQMLFLTATCTKSVRSSFENLIGVKCNSIHWPSNLQMVNRKVRIEVVYTPLWYSSVQKTIAFYLPTHATLPNKVIIYSNARQRILKLVEKLENYLDAHEKFEEIDVLTLVGTLSRAEKAATIKRFLNGMESEMKMNILCATSGVGNAGIDCKDVRAVYRVDFPPSIADLSQECGRAGRRDDATPDHFVYQVAICLESFLHIFKRINHPDTRSADASYRIYQMDELMDVACLLSSSSHCYYIRIEQKLGNPYVSVEDEPSPCGSCPNCLGSHLFPYISKEGMKTILFDIFLCGPNQIKDRRTPQCVWRSIRDYPNSGPMLLRSRSRKTQPPLGTIKKIMFQLIASQIIDIQFDTVENEVLLGLSKANDATTELAMNVDTFWDSVKTFP